MSGRAFCHTLNNRPFFSRHEPAVFSFLSRGAYQDRLSDTGCQAKLDKWFLLAYIGVMEATPESAAKRAIVLLGGVRSVAEEFGITTQAVHQWRRIPAEHVVKIETLLRGRISRHELRPDIFGERA